MIPGEILEIMVDIRQPAPEMVDFVILVVGMMVMEHLRLELIAEIWLE